MTKSSNNNIQSVIKTFNLIEVLSMHEGGLNIRELEEKLGMHKSSIYRIISTLTDIGYINKTIEGNYRLTLKVLGLGNKLLNDINIIDIVKPHLMEISLKTNQSTHLTMFDKNEAIYLDVIHPKTNSFRANSFIGKRGPINVTAVGKVFLANRTDEEIKKIWRDIEEDLVQYTPNTITNLKKMMEVVEKARENKYALDDEEHEYNVFCIGIPLYSHDGVVRHAISVSFPKSIMTPELFSETIDLLRGYSERISAELGYSK